MDLDFQEFDKECVEGGLQSLEALSQYWDPDVVNLISMCVPSQTSSYPHIWVQQYRFLKQILKRPDYALFVREFRWTSKSPLLLSKSDHDMLFRELKLVFSTHELLDRIY